MCGKDIDVISDEDIDKQLRLLIDKLGSISIVVLVSFSLYQIVIVG